MLRDERVYAIRGTFGRVLVVGVVVADRGGELKRVDHGFEGDLQVFELKVGY